MLDTHTPNTTPVASEDPAGDAWRYLHLGVRHILEGWDHLAFVGLLMLIIGMPRRRGDRQPEAPGPGNQQSEVGRCALASAITAFSLGHSLTLAWAALGQGTFSVPKIEALIALSIVLLAVEAGPGNEEAWTRRFPGLIAFSFGLVHGLGFASVLRDVGLPASQQLLALGAFNVGIELGQLAVVAGILGITVCLEKTTSIAKSPKPREALRYLLGTGGAYAFIERVAALF